MSQYVVTVRQKGDVSLVPEMISCSFLLLLSMVLCLDEKNIGEFVDNKIVLVHTQNYNLTKEMRRVVLSAAGVCAGGSWGVLFSDSRGTNRISGVGFVHADGPCLLLHALLIDSVQVWECSSHDPLG